MQKLILDQLELTPPIRQIVMLIIALIVVVLLVYLVANVFSGGAGLPRVLP